jgi:hypothetical protein
MEINFVIVFRLKSAPMMQKPLYIAHTHARAVGGGGCAAQSTPEESSWLMFIFATHKGLQSIDQALSWLATLVTLCQLSAA